MKPIVRDVIINDKEAMASTPHFHLRKRSSEDATTKPGLSCPASSMTLMVTVSASPYWDQFSWSLLWTELCVFKIHMLAP